ncbi:Ryanodine receptor [Taenia solium]|eukprot:TsM_000353500 transcript=TsM_000353500 gene=TsM_000353500
MKLLVRVVLPLLERYFYTRKSYFIDPYSGASIEEKKMTPILVNVTASCRKCLIKCLDIEAIVKISCAEGFVWVRLMPFFSLCADDLNLIIRNLNSGRYSHIKGTIRRGVCSIDYLHIILLPTLKTMFEHISKTGVGELMGGCCVPSFGHRSMLGECLVALTTRCSVALLEPELSAHNLRSTAYNTKGTDYTFEARGKSV